MVVNVKENKSGGLLLTVLLTFLLYIHFHSPIYNNSIFTFRYLFVFAFLYTVFNMNTFMRFLKVFRKEMFFVGVLIAYCAFRTLLGGESTFLVMWIRSVFEFFLIPFTIIHIMFRNKLNTPQDIQRLLMIVGCVGAVITMACILYAPFNIYVKTMWTVIEEDSYLQNLSYRCFGISDNLTYSYGIIQGIILLIGLIAMTRTKWIIPFLPFIAISILLNARTGFVISMAGYAIYLLFQRGKGRNKIATVIGVALIAFVVVYFVSANIDEEGIDWLMTFFNELGIVRSGHVEGTTLGALIGKMAVFPENIEQWIIGRGYSMYLTRVKNTDVGFFLQLNYGGLLYIAPLYGFIVYMYKRMREYGLKVSANMFLVIFLISNLKGNFIPYCGGFRLVFLYYCFYIYSFRQNIVLRDKLAKYN